MRKVEAAAEQTAHVSPEVVWSPAQRRHGVPAVGEILDVEPGKRLAYTVLRGIPGAQLPGRGRIQVCPPHLHNHA